ncbi:hypothetical protein [Roseobacter litoralis]|uniref:hypothetical protein n=1 Tax=Roseobacter litoralis TaxID=42443 RepID=UPI00249434CD|nr:hypothetical protein [Roseobacter litoralis]
MSAAILAAAQARLATALPGWIDETDTPHPTPEDALPAFSVALSVTSSEKVSMGDPRHFREGQLEIILRTAARATRFGGAQGIHAEASTADAAILADPPCLDGTLWDIDPEGFEAEHDAGEKRISQGSLIFTIQYIE